MSHRKRSETISFRCDEHLWRLIDQARAHFGVSRGDWVRGVVHAELYRSKDAAIDLRLAEIERATETLRQSLDRLAANQAKSLFALLTVVGDVAAEDARKLIQQNLVR